MRIRIEAVDLPGRSCPPDYRNVHVAVQRRGKPEELLDLHPGDSSSARWTLDTTPAASGAGVDLKGPHIQGRPGERFVYLSWGTVDDTGRFTMFRRAKLLLDHVPPAVLSTASRDGILVGRLSLTDRHGMPVAGRVTPPQITWTAEPAP